MSTKGLGLDLPTGGHTGHRRPPLYNRVRACLYEDDYESHILTARAKLHLGGKSGTGILAERVKKTQKGVAELCFRHSSTREICPMTMKCMRGLQKKKKGSSSCEPSTTLHPCRFNT